MTRLSRQHLVALGTMAAAGLVLLTGPGPYPRSMVGVPGERLSNMSPPTICILVLGALQLAVVLLVLGFGRFERHLSSQTAAIATIGAAATLTAFALHGFVGTTAMSAAALLYLMRRMLSGYR